MKALLVLLTLSLAAPAFAAAKKQNRPQDQQVGLTVSRQKGVQVTNQKALQKQLQAPKLKTVYNPLTGKKVKKK